MEEGIISIFFHFTICKAKFHVPLMEGSQFIGWSADHELPNKKTTPVAVVGNVVVFFLATGQNDPSSAPRQASTRTTPL